MQTQKVINLDLYPCKPTSLLDIKRVIQSIEKFNDESKRDIDWIECQYCGFRAPADSTTAIHSHIYKKHRPYVLEIRKQQEEIRKQEAEIKKQQEEKEIAESVKNNNLDKFVCYEDNLEKLKRITESIKKFSDESKRNEDWVECPYCGLRAISLITHIRCTHNEYILNNGEIKCKQVIYAVSSVFLSWLNKNPQYKDLSEPEQRIHFKQWMRDHNMIPDISGDKNPNHKSKTTIEQRKSISPKCIEFYERMYPDLTHEEHLEMINKQNKDMHAKMKVEHKYQSQLDYWLNIHNGDMEKAKASLKERQGTKRLSRFINRYGEEEGKRRFDEMNEKWFRTISKLFKSGSSKIETEFVNWMFIEIPELNNEKRFNVLSYKNHQASITFKTDSGKLNKYKPDVLINRLFVIDFFGDYTHGNQLLYKEDMIIKFGNIGWTVKQKNEFDLKRKAILEQKGYQVLYVWEHDFLNNKELIKQKIKEFLYI